MLLEEKKKAFLLYICITAERKLVRKVGSDCRVSHDPASLRQARLKVMLKGPTVAARWF